MRLEATETWVRKLKDPNTDINITRNYKWLRRRQSPQSESDVGFCRRPLHEREAQFVFEWNQNLWLSFHPEKKGQLWFKNGWVTFLNKSLRVSLCAGVMPEQGAAR